MTTYRLAPYTIEPADDRAEKTPPGVEMIKAPEVWDDSMQGKGIVVAILDTGCDKNHPDLQNRILFGKNTTEHGDESDFSDIADHGTHVAGTIAANGTGIFGVAPQARLAIYRVFTPTEDPNRPAAFNEHIIAAIKDCIKWNQEHNKKDHIRIINMSLGGPRPDENLHKAIQEAVKNEILVICAAGNEGDPRSGGDSSAAKDEYGYPARHPEVISVAAIKLDRSFVPFSNTNLDNDLTAPGFGILSTVPKNKDNSDGVKDGYATFNGTSMAAPHVSGAAALIIKQCETDFGRTLTETEIYAQLIKRTVSLGLDRRIEGNGLLDLTEGYRTFPNRNQL
ncbi:S8 family peptidase [Bacillus cereus]|uniref:S8 family peptidase n=1 Tax=Bacillus cereus TaxID=1396 RepID=A0A9X5C4C2_BACCE|nr:S8 family peptidase [Bacillus cereus]MCJ0850262.1 S8 family peptidase [Bacillus cereus]MCU5646120.1 S8 family peptidase [Bacillus cereus]MDA2051312.1 S8 family peptidase [Bacillus cereus]MDN4877063.1 S8 family peptidase [Bacillus cereus]NCA65677.1 serine protease [Bacillus cereus]